MRRIKTLVRLAGFIGVLLGISFTALCNIGVSLASDNLVTIEGFTEDSPVVVNLDQAIYMAPDPTGNDNTGDGSRSNPYRTLEKCSEMINGATDYTLLTGDVIVLLEGTYQQETTFIGYDTNFRGKDKDNPLILMGDPFASNKPTIDASIGSGNHTSAVSITTHLSSFGATNEYEADVQYLIIKDIVFQRGTTMGLNIDDGGEYSRNSPAQHIIIQDCEFYDNNPDHDQGSGLKLAGVDDFIVRNSVFRRIGHNGIDMVGCHDGHIINNIFADNLAAGGGFDGLGVTVKGGSRNILIEKNIFKDLYGYGVSIGQSTSLHLFRPICGGTDADGETMNYEAKDIKVFRNMFINVGYPIMFSRSKNCEVYHNTIYAPINNANRTYGIGGAQFMIFFRHDEWPSNCEDGTPIIHAQYNKVKNNIFYFGTPYGNRPVTFGSASPQWCYEPETNEISSNLWYCHDNIAESLPDWDFMDTYQWGSPIHYDNIDIVGDPEFINANPSEALDFRLSSELSPPVGAGDSSVVSEVPKDFQDNYYTSPPSLGAFEYTSGFEQPVPYFDPPIGNRSVVAGQALGIELSAEYNPDSTLIYTCDNLLAGMSLYHYCELDLTNDGIINLSDFATFGAAYNSQQGDEDYNSQADFNRDGLVNTSDLAMFSKVYQEQGPMESNPYYNQAHFLWRTTEADIGLHQVSFSVTNGTNSDSETITIEVLSAAGGSEISSAAYSPKTEDALIETPSTATPEEEPTFKKENKKTLSIKFNEEDRSKNHKRWYHFLR